MSDENGVISPRTESRTHADIHGSCPFPYSLTTGHNLTEDDVAKIKEEFATRDRLIEQYRGQEKTLNSRLLSQHEYVQRVLRGLRAPVVGFGMQDGPVSGVYPDLWVGPRMSITIKPRRRISGISLHGWLPDEMPEEGQLTLQVGDHVVTIEMAPGLFTMTMEFPGGTDAPVTMTVEATKSMRPEGPGRREVAFVLREIELEHPEYAPALMARLGRQAVTTTSSSETDSARPARTVLLHYHLFKNAGSSVDEVLKANFGDAWGEQEFELPQDTRTRMFHFNTGKVCDHLRAHPELKALSSHTALLPVPELEGVSIFPIVFIRHPLDRLRSAYQFEVSQDGATYGSRLAKAQGFAGYLRELMRHPVDRAARNFQTHRLAANEPAVAGIELERAMNVLNSFEFVGLVEAYEASMVKLQELLGPRIPGFKAFVVRENVSRPQHLGLDERLAMILTEIGAQLFGEVLVANADDLALYEAMAAQYRPEL